MVLGDCLLNVFTVYAPHSGKPDEERERFWSEVFHLVSCVPQNGMVVFAGDVNGSVGSGGVGCGGTHGGFGCGSGGADGSRILESAGGLNWVICGTLFARQEARLVACVAGPVKSTVDCVVVRRGDGAKVRNVKVVSVGECVSEHKLLMVDVWFKAAESWRGGFGPGVRVWRLREEETCEECRCVVGDKVEEAGWKGLCVDDRWQQVKGIVMETARDVWYNRGTTRTQWDMVVECGGWWGSWERRMGCGKWGRENAREAGMEYGNSGQNAGRVVSSAGEGRRRECVNDLDDSGCRGRIFRMARRMVRERRDMAGLGCVEGASGRVIVEGGGSGTLGGSAWRD